MLSKGERAPCVAVGILTGSCVKEEGQVPEAHAVEVTQLSLLTACMTITSSEGSMWGCVVCQRAPGTGACNQHEMCWGQAAGRCCDTCLKCDLVFALRRTIEN